MMNLGQALSKSKLAKASNIVNIEKLKQEIIDDDDIAEFIKKNQITDEIINRDLSVLNNFRKDKTGNEFWKPELRFDNNQIYIVETPAETDTRKRLDDGVPIMKIYFDSITEEFRNVTFDEVEITKQNAYLVDAFKRLINKYSYKSIKKGLWINGKFGRGKSYILSAVANDLYRKGASVAFVHAGQLISDLKESMNYKSNDSKAKINMLSNIEVLIIDDIGTESISEWSIKNVIYEILNTRMKNESLTFFTSNLTQVEYMNQLKNSKRVTEIDAERLNERIKKLSKEIQLSGENWREKV